MVVMSASTSRSATVKHHESLRNYEIRPEGYPSYPARVACPLAIILSGEGRNRLKLQFPGTDWVPLPWSADSLESPDAASFVSVGMIVAAGEPAQQDCEVWRHPQRQEGRRSPGG
jgi:hypothetical protein